MRKHLVLIVEADPKHRTREHRGNGALQFDWFFVAQSFLYSIFNAFAPVIEAEKQRHCFYHLFFLLSNLFHTPGSIYQIRSQETPISGEI